jgi:pimeloyl-ACP methyl ester carboxylesterase
MPFDGRMWAAQASAFPGATVVPSLYQFGESLAQWAEAVLDLTDANDLVVVGSSCGGSCALEMARLRPDRIAALVLVGSKAAHRPEPELRDRYVALQRHGGAPALWNELGHRYFGPSSPASAVAQGRAWAMEQSPEDLVRGTVAFHSRPDASDVVAHWVKPLTVVVGEDDGFVSVNKARELAASSPRGVCHVVPGAGHFPSLDAPDVFNALLRAAVDAVRVTA